MNPHLSPAQVRFALRSLQLHPTRGMGQNFLIDEVVLAQIVAAAELASDDLVVEVGPGLGVLTWELLRQAGFTIAVELDKRLVDRLQNEFRACQNFQLLQGDILNLSPEAILTQAGKLEDTKKGKPYKVVANLPYAITSPVLRHFLENAPQPQFIVVLVQWEVAKRITAKPGDLSVLAHAIQMYAEPEIVARVPAASFVPQPAVDSAILRLRVRSAPAGVGVDNSALFRVIKAGFLQARKKLGNALPIGLAAMGVQITREDALEALATAGVAPEKRAETVTLVEWTAIYKTLQATEKLHK